MTSCVVGLKMDLLLFILPYICSFFFLSRFLSKISPQLFKIETSNLVYRFTTARCSVGLKMGLLQFFLPYICPFFFLSRFLSKISPQPFKIETSNLIYRFAMTSCKVGLQIDILLLVFSCIFLSTFIIKDTSHMLWKC